MGLESFNRMQDLPPSERPLERLLRQGAGALSSAELLAVILRAGHPGTNALELARLILIQAGAENDISHLSDFSISELLAITGIGPVKAAQIAALIELAHRFQESAGTPDPQLSTPEAVVSRFGSRLRVLDHERLSAVLLDNQNRLIKNCTISEGSVASVTIQARDVFRHAVKANAVGIILMHNHPSGDPTPSQDDINTTRQLIAAGKLIGIEVYDHIIVGRFGSKSLRRESHLWKAP
ncbi:MAG: DNA repair protein RadC [Oscillospiraceae bacterium]|nr:DNA repair protein RadC [Oscillospiraceae bacterium]MDD4368585.1 DNA repair protein RadC [Oscillospiraceae bacterium]